MTEQGEYRRQTMGERLQARLDYMFRPSGPVSKEVVRQITKIQSAIPYGEAWEAFEKAKIAAPAAMTAKDDEFRSQGKWHTASKIAQLWFYAPIIVLFSGRSPAAKERGRIRESAKKWKAYLSEDPAGKRLVTAYKGKEAEKRINEIVSRIREGQPPNGKV